MVRQGSNLNSIKIMQAVPNKERNFFAAKAIINKDKRENEKILE